MHEEGISVLMDVVFNHTGEVDRYITSYAGLDPRTYYIFDEEDQYANYSGCGNTVNANNPVTM